jgi:GNAT superfamily N-acetyltransferase
MTIASREYRGDDDYRKLRELLVDAYRVRPGFANWGLARLDTMRYRLHAGEELSGERLWEREVRLWEAEDGRLVAAVHPENGGDVRIQVHPRFKEIENEVFAWAEDRARVLPSRDGRPPWLYIHCDPGDRDREETLVRRGYTRDDEPDTEFVKDLHEEIPEPSLPRGFTVRGMETEEDLERWMDCAWSAFPHWRQRYSLAKRRVLQRAPTYREDLDLVVVGPDETFIAFCPVWWDAANRLAEFEPIGTRAEYQGQGFMTALLRTAMQEARARGGNIARMGGRGGVQRKAGFSPCAYASWTKEL